MMSMRFDILGRNIEVTPGLRAAVEEKLGKLDKFFNPDTEVHVTLSVEKDRQTIEVTIPVKGNIIRSEQVSNDMYISIDLVDEVKDGPHEDRGQAPVRNILHLSLHGGELWRGRGCEDRKDQEV